jgi:hypothetical protein
MSAEHGEPVSVECRSNGEQRLLVFDGDGVSCVVALEYGVDEDDARELAETIDDEVEHSLEHVRRDTTKTNRGP